VSRIVRGFWAASATGRARPASQRSPRSSACPQRCAVRRSSAKRQCPSGRELTWMPALDRSVNLLGHLCVHGKAGRQARDGAARIAATAAAAGYAPAQPRRRSSPRYRACPCPVPARTPDRPAHAVPEVAHPQALFRPLWMPPKPTPAGPPSAVSRPAPRAGGPVQLADAAHRGYKAGAAENHHIETARWRWRGPETANKRPGLNARRVVCRAAR
jgi:hypothetical protein